jgi:hypothetical protein
MNSVANSSPLIAYFKDKRNRIHIKVRNKILQGPQVAVTWPDALVAIVTLVTAGTSFA